MYPRKKVQKNEVKNFKTKLLEKSHVENIIYIQLSRCDKNKVGLQGTKSHDLQKRLFIQKNFSHTEKNEDEMFHYFTNQRMMMFVTYNK